MIGRFLALLVIAAATPSFAARGGSTDDETFLLAASSSADAGARGEAALALFHRRFANNAPEYSTAAVSRLIQLAGDPDAEVRWRAVYAFSRWPEPRAAAALAAAQDDADARARLFAVRGLGKLKMAPDPARLSDSDIYVRAEAVAAFSAAKAWDRIPNEVFVDSSAHVRAAAADAAGESGDAARFAALVSTMAAEPGTLAPGRALVALARLRGGGAAPEIARARKDPRWWIRSRAYEAAAFLPGGDGLLLEGIGDPDPRVAAQALETLATSTSPAAAEVLQDVLQDTKAPLELLGTAVDAAGDRADPRLRDGLLAAMRRADDPAFESIRGDIRKSLLAIAAKDPPHAAEIAKALQKFPPFKTKPRRFKPVESPPAVVFETERGSFTIVLASAPVAANHVAAFVEDVRKGFYDGLVWHRVVTAFVVQGGDPRGSGWGDAGWRLADEASPIPFLRGTVGMPKSGPDTGGCQLFITLVPAPHLDGRYTAFGRVVAGIDVVDQLEPGDKILRARATP